MRPALEAQSDDLLPQAWPGGFHLGICFCYRQLWQLFKLRLCVEKGVLLWSVSVETIGHTCHSILYNHTQAFGLGVGAFEDPLLLGSC